MGYKVAMLATWYGATSWRRMKFSFDDYRSVHTAASMHNGGKKYIKLKVIGYLSDEQARYYFNVLIESLLGSTIPFSVINFVIYLAGVTSKA